MGDYLPTRDEALQTWVENFSALITATPTAFGLVAGDATALAALVTAYTTALEAAKNPSTRTPVTVTTKNTARAQLIADVRALARKIQATSTVTAAQKTSLGLTVADRVPSPVPPPATRPLLAVLGNGGKTITIRLVDEATPTRRARATGSAGAEVYSYVPANGDPPPSDLELWRFEGVATRGTFDVDFEAADVGKTAHIRAAWFNRRGQSGPASDEITATVAN